MNEVEKMYRNLGIKKIELDYPDNFEPFYPEFTAEKQLILLKRIIKSYTISISYSIDAYNIKARSKNGKNEHLEVNNYLDEGLASIIIDIWQDLTDAERKQIKEILSE